MIQKVGDILHDDGLSKDELLGRVKVGYTNYCDVMQIADLMVGGFNVSDMCFSLEQLIKSRVDLKGSVKVYDEENGNIYGFLLLSEFRIEDGSPIRHLEPTLMEVLNCFSQINGFAFILDKRLRGCGFDKKMIEAIDCIINRYDLVWIAVDNDLRSHNYWKRMGFREVFSFTEAVFYAKFTENVENADIYYKMLFFNSNDHRDNRETREDINSSGLE